MPRKSAITVTSRADAAKTANVALLRRLQGNPHGAGSRTIPLKDPQRWHTYIETTEVNADAHYQMKEKGWVPLRADDLACDVAESGFSLSPDGYLVRGAQGREMVFKMAVEDYRMLVDAKTRANMHGIGSASKIKADMTEAAGKQIGDEAASYINSIPGQVVDELVSQP